MNKPKRILLVEDDESLGYVIKDNLLAKNFEVTLAKNGVEGIEMFNSHKYDICLLDVMMPGKDGFSLAEEIRTKNADIPIIFLTAKSMEEDKIKGFLIGADDYITKPFSMPELTLRIEAILKRTNSFLENSITNFIIGNYSFDYTNQLLVINKEQKTLTKKEADLLKLLASSQNIIVPREDILKQIWGEDDYFLGRSMDVFITRLRKYLKNDERIKIINVHGVGFKLEVNA